MSIQHKVVMENFVSSIEFNITLEKVIKDSKLIRLGTLLKKSPSAIGEN